MKHLRPLLLALSTLVLLAACSQPEDVQGELETQFGTSGNDAATAVSVAPNGVVTKAVVLEAADNKRSTIYIRQLDGNARLVREIKVGTFACYPNCNYQRHVVEDIKVDGQGSIYVRLNLEQDCSDIPCVGTTLYKYGKTGPNPVWQKDIGRGLFPAGGLNVDGSGNAYIAQTEQDTVYNKVGLSYFTRYNSNGVKWWQRNSQVGPIRDIAVAGNGDIYIVGNKGVSRYNNGGSILWTKAIPGTQIETSGSYVYVLEAAASNGDIRLSKRTSSGAQVWSKTIANEMFSYINAFTVDSLGNSYFGFFAPDIEPPAIRKLSASGTQVWSINLRFGGANGYPAGPRDLATYNGDSIYAVGDTLGPVNGANHGGTDAFIVRLNAQGQKVWER